MNSSLKPQQMAHTTTIQISVKCNLKLIPSNDRSESKHPMSGHDRDEKKYKLIKQDMWICLGQGTKRVESGTTRKYG